MCVMSPCLQYRCICLSAHLHIVCILYSAMRDVFMRAADGFLLVYAIDNSKSFDDVEAFREQVYVCSPFLCLSVYLPV